MMARIVFMIRFVRLAWQTYKSAEAQEHGTHYAALTYRCVPQVAMFIGVGRNAWRISQRAAEEFVVTVR